MSCDYGSACRVQGNLVEICYLTVTEARTFLGPGDHLRYVFAEAAGPRHHLCRLELLVTSRTPDQMGSSTLWNLEQARESIRYLASRL